jgi:hypothetical protein
LEKDTLALKEIEKVLGKRPFEPAENQKEIRDILNTEEDSPKESPKEEVSA